MTDTITFFNYFHNGDLHFSREFCKDIMQQLPDYKFQYCHSMKTYVLEDVCEFKMLGSIPDPHSMVTPVENNLFVNTWIGQSYGRFHQIETPHHCGINGNYAMYTEIYDMINRLLKTNLKLKESKNEYIPNINFDKISNIKDLKVNFKKKPILFCNNLCHSGQSHNYDLTPVIENISSQFKDEIFLVTNRYNNYEFTQPNVFYIDTFNLNQIGYYSLYCKLIIGRSSGPYCFALTKKNLYDSTKSFIGLGTDHGGEKDLCWGIKPAGLWFYNLSPDLKSVEETIYYGISEHIKKHS